MEKINLAVVGAGWRAEFFLRAAKLVPELFSVCGVVTRNSQKAADFLKEFGVRSYSCIDDLLANEKFEYAVVSVSADAAHSVSLSLAQNGVPVLLETPAGSTTDNLTEFYQGLPVDAKIQVAEQYFLRPVQSAMLACLADGRIGMPVEARVSFTHFFHAVSLLRKFLGIGYKNASVRATRFSVPGYPGFSRMGPADSEALVNSEHIIATLDFGDRLAIYDFEADQHRSWIRSPQIQIKGTSGEIFNDQIRYLLDYKTPMESRFVRKTMGENENMEGFGLKGIVADGKWYYRNPYIDSRMTDDEIAVAETMRLMGEYVRGGQPFYSFAEASQDAYLAYLIKQAAETGDTLQSNSQIWAG